MKNDIKKCYEALKNLMAGSSKSYSEIEEASKYLAEGFLKDLTVEEKKEALAQILEAYIKNVGVKAYEPWYLSEGYDPDSDWTKRYEHSPTLYLDRYCHYLKGIDFPIESIDVITDSTKKILAFFADPEITQKKKGLVIGDVQSGKTSNYISIINLACDYGYKLIILLAGLTDSLRTQTQERVDAGFIGANSDTLSGNIEYLGVGNPQNDYFAIPLTNRKSDFSKFIKQNTNSNTGDYKKPLVLVVKKNVSVLRQVLEWVDPRKGNLSVKSVLIIDDEADNASINTQKLEDDQPSKVNGIIRDIFNTFPSATYVGYTATPYANVFINPNDDDPEYVDLFPSDFIIMLKPSSNYFGSEKVFERSLENNYKHISMLPEEEPNSIEIGHNKTTHFNEIPKSLKMAILTFLINCVIRTLRGSRNKHRTMLVNVSTYINVHEEIRVLIDDYIERIRLIITQTVHESENNFLRNEEMRELYNLFHSESYHKVRENFVWTDIKDNLAYEIEKMQTAVYNRKYTLDRFRYSDYEEVGARLIAVGGYVLSRGLTLEGLMVSYFKRKGSTYDTMMQMSRWFGYRVGADYEDLCLVYMTQENFDTFEAIIDATANLKEQFSDMTRLGKTPKDYGLMIKEKPEVLETNLLITARNKMRNTKVFYKILNYGGESVDTSKIFVDRDKNTQNLRRFKELLNDFKLSGQGFEFYNDRLMVKDVQSEIISAFLSKLQLPIENKAFEIESLVDFINEEKYYKKWDIVIATGSKNSEVNKWDVYDKSIYPSIRSYLYKNGEPFLRISGNKNRLLDPGIFNSGLTQTQTDFAKKIAQHRFDLGISKTNTPISSDYLAVPGRNPLLIIQPMVLKNINGIFDSDSYIYESTVVLGFGLGFPKVGSEGRVLVKYRLNKVKLDQMTKEYEYNDPEEEN